MADSCEIVQGIVSSLFLKTVLICSLAWSLFGIPLNVVMIIVTCRHNLVHYNTKWIMVTHHLCIVIHNILRIANHVWELMVFSKMDAKCSQFLSLDTCVYVRVPVQTAVYLTFFSTFLLSMERSVATYKLESYEINRSVGPSLVFVQVLLGAACVCAMSIGLELPNPLIYCVIASLASVLVLYSQIIVFLLFQILAIMIFRHLSKLNQKMKERLLSNGNKQLISYGRIITELYQVRENSRTMEALFPFLLLSCFITFSCNAIRAAVIYYKNEFSYSTFYGLLELLISTPLYSIMLPIVLWYSYRKVKRKVALCGFLPAPIFALRSLKSETVAGLPEDVAEQMRQKPDRNWMVSGDYGVAQLAF